MFGNILATRKYMYTYMRTCIINTLLVCIMVRFVLMRNIIPGFGSGIYLLYTIMQHPSILPEAHKRKEQATH